MDAFRQEREQRQQPVDAIERMRRRADMLTETGVDLKKTSNTEATWTLGGGLEWALDPNWSVKAEYMYVGLDKTISDCGFLATSFCYDHNLRGISTAKVGLNYRFNGAAWLGLR